MQPNELQYLFMRHIMTRLNEPHKHETSRSGSAWMMVGSRQEGALKHIAFVDSDHVPDKPLVQLRSMPMQRKQVPLSNRSRGHHSYRWFGCCGEVSKGILRLTLKTRAYASAHLSSHNDIAQHATGGELQTRVNRQRHDLKIRQT